MTEGALAIQEGEVLAVGIPVPPERVLEGAMAAAKALTGVLSQKKDKVMMGGQQYLEMEDWSLLGQFYGVAVKTHDAIPVEVYGVKGAKAEANLIVLHTGEVIGGAEAYCMRDEPKWNMRTKYEWQDGPNGRERVAIGEEPVPWFQLASMAQTRAAAKALRNRLSWVVVLAGYKPTPAEELTGDEVPAKAQPRPSGHFCKEHGVPFFRSGKMKSYAHPVKDANGQEVKDEQGKIIWCHEHTETASSTLEAPKPVPDGEPMTSETLLKLVFMNPGQFYTACLKFFVLDKSAVDKEVGMYDLNIPDQRAKAWETIVNSPKGAK